MAEKSEIRLVRLYNAPVDVVWNAWVDSEQVAQWWGPRGFTITTHDKDIRPGGHWDYTMHGPDGKDYPNITRYLEVVHHAKLVYDHGGSKTANPMFRVTALFSENSGKTTLDLTLAFETPEAAEASRKHIKAVGGDATWDRLAEYLAKKQSGKELFVITRSFNAPIHTVFDHWINPLLLEQWTAPTGMTMKYLRVNIEAGGSSFYVMGNDNLKLYGRVEYLEIDKPHRLVYTQQFVDEQEKPSHHPLAPTFPSKMKTRVEFVREAENQTRIRITWEPLADGLETFIQMRPSMTLGWTGSLDKLEKMLG